MRCIGGFWDRSDVYQCPLCKRAFPARPDLSVNRFVRELTEQFQKVRVDSPAERGGQPAGVPCDVCTGERLEAVKSCLVCLASYCGAHLEPHLRVVTLRGHKLVSPTPHLEDRMCPRHGRPLELFCRRDRTCICVLCTEMDHRAHSTVPAEREWSTRKGDLEQLEVRVHLMIQERLRKVKEIKQAAELSRRAAQREREDGARVFAALLSALERGQAELLEEIEGRARAAERRAGELVTALEQEVAELRRRSAELEQLSRTEDHIHFLQNYLKAAIVAGDAVSALSGAFLIDRFLYWVDASHKLLQIAKALHKRYPTTPIAPQLVIRLARLSVNTGKLQKAEFILSSLINNSGATGCWVYQQESDRTLVQAVSIQIRGQILQKLGLWREAAELVWASLIGFCALPQPDKKGIGTSLGLLANILASMNDQEYEAFKTSPHVDFSCLKELGHRLLSAAEAARRAVVIQGTCLLSYSLSEDCPAAERRAFLTRAKEAFEIGLLTKTADDSVASRQELHTFVKAAFCLTAARRWLGLGEEAAARAERSCREATALLYAYAAARGREKDGLSRGVMGLVGGVKAALGVAGFPKSDGKSYVPDSYLAGEEELLGVQPDGFHGVVRRYAQYHASVCEAFESPCRHPKTGTGASGGACITALKTATEALETECGPGGRRGGAEARRREFAKTRGRGHGAGGPAGAGGSSDHTFAAEGSGGAPACREDAETKDPSPGETDDVSPLPLVSPSERPDLVPFDGAAGSRLRDFYDMDTEAETADDLMDPPVAVAGDGVSRPRIYSPEDCASTRRALMPCGVPACREDAETKDPSLGETDDVSPSKRPDHVPFDGAAGSRLRDFYDMDTEAETADDLMDPPVAVARDGVGRPRISSKAGAEPHRRPSPSGSPPSTGTGSSFEMMESDREGRFQSPDPQGDARASRTSSEAPDAAGRDRAGSRGALMPASSTEEQRFFEEVTEEGGGEEGEGEGEEQLALLLSSSHSSASSGRSFFSEDDYRRLLSGVGHTWLLNRLKYTGVFKPKMLRGTHNALLLKYSKASDSWSARETQVHIGASTGKKGKQRSAFWVQFLHQEEVLGSYVGKEYQSEKELRYHLNDVERQMTAQYYVTEFNKKLYEKQIPMQIYFIPSEVLLILEDRLIKGCVSVEPYMLGDFVKLTNNKKTVVRDYRATDYGIAFGHFTYEFSGRTEIVVDLQGWVTGNGKGLTYLTDPQIHSLKKPKSSSNFYQQGIEYFLQDQHGADCNEICQMLSLGKLTGM
ncbi:ALPK1 kinase, partial [Atractosteus spatula]|nr:ALPK1 kinase [Atractosteus spatula]